MHLLTFFSEKKLMSVQICLTKRLEGQGNGCPEGKISSFLPCMKGDTLMLCYINYFFFEAMHHPINTPPVQSNLQINMERHDSDSCGFLKMNFA